MAISAKKRLTNDKYNAKCTQINIKPLTPEAEKIKQAAADAGQSLQGYILDAIRERMQRDAARAGQHSTEGTAPSAPTPTQE